MVGREAFVRHSRRRLARPARRLPLAGERAVMKIEELERRLAVLEDIEEIKRLKAHYAALCDDHYNSDGIAALFTPDGVWDGGDLGRAEGRDAIRAFFVKAPKAFPFAIHNVMNPIIEVSGDSARGRWYLLQPMTMARGNQAAWLAGRYDEEYVRTAEGWRFRRLKFIPLFMTPYEEGWAKKKFI
jgi:uncharacterized small protein (DUF1192 family)